MECPQQRCLHLIRDLNDDFLKQPFDKELEELMRAFSSVLRPIIETVDRFGLKTRFLRKHKKAVEQFYRRVAESDYQGEAANQYKKRFEKNREKRLNGVFDWSRIGSEALGPLRAGRPGRWHAFDFVRGLGKGGTYSLKEEVTEVAPSATILVEGAYSASPPLRDSIDLAVLVFVQNKTRHLRAAVRERDDTEFLAKWHAMWDEVEAYYFQQICPPESFDLVILNDDKAEPSSPANWALPRR